MTIKRYWLDYSTRGTAYHNAYRMVCPVCHKRFIMPKSWGVWKGCPVCWTKLEYKKGYNENLKKF